MEKYLRFDGLVAPLMRADIDTDAIIPSREITTPTREGFAERLFAGWRYLRPGSREENPEFVLNRAPFRAATILVAGRNFGCGSSREAAVWALRQFGFRCVIAPSFGGIFRNNCYGNGVLPVVLPSDRVDELGRRAESGALQLTVDLESSTLSSRDGWRGAIEIEPEHREMLLLGLDAIELTERHREKILAFQQAQAQRQPWIWGAPP